MDAVQAGVHQGGGAGECWEVRVALSGSDLRAGMLVLWDWRMVCRKGWKMGGLRWSFSF